MATATIAGVGRAEPGDRLVIRGHSLASREPDGEILDVLGEDGSPPFVVRWSDDGHVSTLFPGPDAFVEHFERRRAMRQRVGRSWRVRRARGAK